MAKTKEVETVAEVPAIPSAFKTGTAALPRSGGDGSGAPFVKLEENQPVEVIPLAGMNELISINQHGLWRDAGSSPVFTCIAGTGQECPGCRMKNEAKYKAFLPVLFKDKEGKVVAGIFSMGISIVKQLAEIESMREAPITGKPIKVKRTGKAMATRYAVVATEKPVLGKDVLAKYDKPDIVAALGPMTTEGIKKLLQDKDYPYVPVGAATKTGSLDVLETSVEETDWEGL